MIVGLLAKLLPKASDPPAVYKELSVTVEVLKLVILDVDISENVSDPLEVSISLELKLSKVGSLTKEILLVLKKL